MGRQLRTKIPVVPPILEHHWVELKQIGIRIEKFRIGNEVSYNNNNKIQNLIYHFYNVNTYM